MGNDYEVTVVMDSDIAAAALSDDVADTINYAEVYEVVRQVMMEPCHLLERVVWNIGAALLTRFDRLAAVERRETQSSHGRRLRWSRSEDQSDKVTW